jgi:LacI family gluconate utilization system Gnt-I transcriptional repressor
MKPREGKAAEKAAPGAERTRLAGRKSVLTLAEVARLAQVSEITASRVLRDEGYVSEATRAKVKQAAELIGYVPNRIAGSLASARSDVVGVILPSLTNIVFPEVLRGIHDGVAGTDLQPVLGITDYDPDTEEKLIRSLLSWKPAAMIVAGFDHTSAARLMLDRSGIRIAEIMDVDPNPIDLAVGFSNRRAGMEIGRYLLGRNYRRFGYVGHDWSADLRAKRRYEGLCEALALAGLGVVAQTIAQSPSSALCGAAMTAQLLERAPEVDCIVFSNDDMAFGGLFHCMKAGVAVPEKVAVFGFNGLEIGEALPKPLSTMRSNRFEMGRTAIRKILESIDRRPGPSVVDTGFEIVPGATA